mgnify:CR=1 FL=1
MMKREKSHGTRLFDAIRTRFGRHDREQDREVEEDLLKAVYELGGRIAADAWASRSGRTRIVRRPLSVDWPCGAS